MVDRPSLETGRCAERIVCLFWGMLAMIIANMISEHG